MKAGEVGAGGVRRRRYLEEAGGRRQEWEPRRVEQAGGWVRQYRQALGQGRQGVAGGTLVAPGVKTQGVSPGSAPQVPPQGAGRGPLPRTQQLGAE